MELRSRKHYSPNNHLLYACGFTREELEGPIVAVFNSYTGLCPGHLNLNTLAEYVKIGIRMAGGTPIEFPCIAFCDGIASHHYTLPSRDIIADTMELCAEAYQVDGLVCLSSCDKIVPGQLMGIARLNLPSLVVTGGAMMPGEFRGEPCRADQYIAEAMRFTAGTSKLTAEELEEMKAAASPTAGSCQGMYTANSMQVITEVLGMSLPGSGSSLQVDTRKLHLSKASGRQMVQLIKDNILPKDILTREAFENAIRVAVSVGASTNLAIHLPAIAHELDIKVTIDDFDRLSRTTPQLVKIAPSGPHSVWDLDRAGGIPAVMQELSPLLHLDSMTVTGQTVKENIGKARVYNQAVIRSMDNPWEKEGGMVVLRGTLAPEGAIARTSSTPPECFQWEANARVFNSMQEASLAMGFSRDGVHVVKEASATKASPLKDGDIVIIRYEGMKGSPGAPEAVYTTYMVLAQGFKRIGLITDARLSGTTRGLAICHVSPEAAAGGPIGLVEDGDKIRIDIPNRKLDLLVSEEELAKRRKKWQAPQRERVLSFMQRWTRDARPLHEGGMMA
ncbi:MAG: dihydroxy-acid dehydratase [Chloroflexota bacterium]